MPARTVRTVLACLSDYDEALVRELAGEPDPDVLEVRIASGSGDRAELDALLAGADLVVADAARRYVLDADVVAGLDRCRFVQQPAVGYDSIDVAAAAARGIAVANAPGYNAAAVADWTLLAMLAVLRDAVAGDAAARAGLPLPGLGRELGALTVGLIGMGAVGRAVAARVAGFGAPVLFCARSRHSIAGAQQVTGRDEVLERADIVSLHVPLTADTRAMIGADELDRMRPGAVLVNCARGGLVDEPALVAGLRAGRPAAAALDVFATEPLPADSPLCALPNVFLTPHIAGSTEQARVRVRRAVAANLRRVLAGEPAHDVVNGVGAAQGG